MSHVVPPPAVEQVAAVRRFNRFYTRLVGALDEGHLRSPFSLVEVRVLYELAHRDGATPGDLARDLRLDSGYLSRLLRSLEERALVQRRTSPSDGRRSLLALTDLGRETFVGLDAHASADVATLLAPLDAPRRRALVHAMERIERTFAPEEPRTPYLLRAPHPGDLGWIVHRQAVLYHDEYGWDERYEALIARIVADFVEQLAPAGERCWVAERDDEIVGSVFVVRHPEREGVARLRLLYVEPAARGLGIGRRLVRECTRFARRAGYHTLTLWTNSVLVSARRIYEAEGYRLVSEASHHSFGHHLVGQTWELSLA